MIEKRKLNPFIPISILLFIVVIILSVACAKFYKTSVDFKAAYDILVEEENEAKQVADEYKRLYDNLIEEENKAKQDANDYQNSYNSLMYAMLDDAVLAENVGNLTVKVWHNAIWNVEDSETDAFTKVNGRFVTDFNEALANLFVDKNYSKDVNSLRSKQTKIKSDMKKMISPPNGFEDAYKALENMYNAYINFTDIVINCKGSLESFSNDFGDADEDILRKYNAAELYVR